MIGACGGGGVGLAVDWARRIAAPAPPRRTVAARAIVAARGLVWARKNVVLARVETVAVVAAPGRAKPQAAVTTAGGAAWVGAEARRVPRAAAEGVVTPRARNARRSLSTARLTRFLAASSETPRALATSRRGLFWKKR